jgi:general stress protein YciG
MARFTSETARAIGHQGGTTTYARHGKEHMQRIGAAGFTATVKRHWNGDARAYLDYLHEKGLLTTCDREMAAMLAVYQEWRPDLFEQLRLPLE